MNKQTKMHRNFLAVGIALSVTFAVSGCDNPNESTKSMTSTATKSDADSMKAVAEAEAAEEAFAKEKKTTGTKRTTASVKKSKKSENTESIFVVQVGTFKVEENAKKIVEKLKAAGLPVVQKKIERDNGVVLYAVRFEPTPNRVEAEKFVSSVKATTGESSLILSVGN